MVAVVIAVSGCGGARPVGAPAHVKHRVKPKHIVDCKKWRNAPTSILDLAPRECLTSKQRAALAHSVAKTNNFINKREDAAAARRAAAGLAQTEAQMCNDLPISVD